MKENLNTILYYVFSNSTHFMQPILTVPYESQALPENKLSQGLHKQDWKDLLFYCIDRGSGLSSVDEPRQQLFCKKTRSLDRILTILFSS